MPSFPSKGGGTSSGSSTVTVTTIVASGRHAGDRFFPRPAALPTTSPSPPIACSVLVAARPGNIRSVVLILRQNSTAGGGVPTLPANVRWPGGNAPTPNTVAGKIDVYTFSTSDGGTTIFGSY